MKYIAEIEMEKKQYVYCPLKNAYTDDCKLQPNKDFVYYDEQMKNCPLKEEACEYILELNDFNTWKCSKCGLLWHLAADTPIENEMYYCPKCGRKIIREVTQN